MTSEIIISAEGLGKKYEIGHKSAERYTALRDVVTTAASRLARSTRDLLQGKPVTLGDQTEDFWALRDVNFSIKRGDVVGIIGSNGAGKSTLLKLLSRITEPTEGRISIGGRVASLLEVGTGFHPELTGRENIYLNGAILGMTRAEIKKRFDEIVEFAGVEKFLDTPVKRYSSGMYVRLAFAVAAHLEPEILIVDEVLAVGDSEFQRKCLGKMRDVASHGRTVLFVSHNLAAVSALCNEGIVLRAGKTQYSGNIGEALSEYSKAHNRELGQSARQSRISDGRYRIELLSQIDPEVSVSQDLFFQLRVTSLREKHSQVKPWLLIYDEYGTEVMMIMPPPNKPIKLNEVENIEIRFKNILRPGTYHISMGIVTLDGAISEWCDYVTQLQVAQSFSSGASFDNRLGKICVEGEWSLC